MGALEVLTGFVTAPGTTLTAWTMASGNSATIRDFPEAKGAMLVQAWADNQTAGTMRIISQKLHEATQGIRLQISLSDTSPLLPWGMPQRFFKNDPLTLQLSGSATAGDIETGALLVYYEELPGTAARFITADDVMKRKRHVFGVENTLALGTAGGYSGEEAINAEFDIFKANTDYALLGYTVSAECAVVGWRGVDTGNLRVGGPGHETLRHVTGEWFVRLSRMYGVALVPVFQSNNRGGILIDGAQDENGTDTTVISIFAELGP